MGVWNVDWRYHSWNWSLRFEATGRFYDSVHAQENALPRTPSFARYELGTHMNIGEAILYGVFVAAWIFGIAVAKGFWMTLGAVLIPPMAWVLLAQWALGV